MDVYNKFSFKNQMYSLEFFLALRMHIEPNSRWSYKLLEQRSIHFAIRVDFPFQQWLAEL